MRRKTNFYYENVTDTRILRVSKARFMFVSKKWDVISIQKSRIQLNGGILYVEIAIYGVDGIECGRVVSQF